MSITVLDSYRSTEDYINGNAKFHDEIRDDGPIDVFHTFGKYNRNDEARERRVLRKASLELRYWADGQREICHWHDAVRAGSDAALPQIPYIVLEKLPRLDTIRNIGHDELVEYVDPHYQGRYPGRSYLELKTLSDMDDMKNVEKAQGERGESGHFESMLLALHRSQKAMANVHLRCLEQFGPESPIKVDLHGLRTLTLDFRGHGEEDYTYCDYIAGSTCDSWFST